MPSVSLKTTLGEGHFLPTFNGKFRYFNKKQ